MKDITTEADVIKMVDSFYDKVNLDPKLSPVFNDFSKVDWDKHLPIMYKFWNTLLLGKQEYKGSPFDKHIPLPIDAQHFDRWIKLFHQNMDELFSGDVADQSKLRASSIAHVFKTKLEFIKEK
jgi:hemoglobin